MPLNREQLEIVRFEGGVLQVIAGPGTGKTEALVSRVVNLLRENIPPSSIMVVTFTRKAAEEFLSRLLSSCRKENVDPVGVYCGTLHSLCFSILEEFGYGEISKRKLVEEFGRDVLMFDLFKNVGFEKFSNLFSFIFGDRWEEKSERQLFGALKGLIDRISLYSVDLERLSSQGRVGLEAAEAYRIYSEFMESRSFIDFNGIEKLFLEFLSSNQGREFLSKISHLLVDEYQDTNPLDEEIYFKIAENCESFVVVGDEDQALYGFRGATVNSFILFEERVRRKLKKRFKKVFLKRNYRSNPDIVDFLNYYINSFTELRRVDRKPKLKCEVNTDFKERSVGFFIRRRGENLEDFVSRFVNLLEKLVEYEIVGNPSDCVLLVPSAREREGSFVEKLKAILERKGIKVYNPRSRNFGRKEGVKRVIDYLEFIVGSTDQLRGVDSLKEEIEKLRKEFEEGNLGLLDSYYVLLSLLDVPNSENPEELFDYSHLSQFISQFESVYSRDEIPEKFSSVFIPFLESTDEPEVPPDYLPEDHLPVMTIHQAKGLEFPVVFLAVDYLREDDREATLDIVREAVPEEVRELLPPTPDFETVKRKLYVAYSRAKNLLIIVDGRERRNRSDDESSLYPDGNLKSIRSYSKGSSERLDLKKFKNRRFSKEKFLRPKVYSFTGDIVSFQICPKQYALKKFFGFSPTNSVQEWFGTAIHRTLRQVYIFFRDKGRIPKGAEIEELFKSVCDYLELEGIRPKDRSRERTALNIVKAFVEREGEEFYRSLRGVEYKVSVERDGYLIQGTIDALVEGEDGLEIWDFKSMRNLERTGRQKHLELYKKQLLFYSILLSREKGRVSKLVLYFLNELLESSPREKMVFLPESTEEFWEEIKGVIEKIEECRSKKHWPYASSVDENTCKVCDFRYSCPTWKKYKRELH